MEILGVGFLVGALGGILGVLGVLSILELFWICAAKVGVLSAGPLLALYYCDKTIGSPAQVQVERRQATVLVILRGRTCDDK